MIKDYIIMVIIIAGVVLSTLIFVHKKNVRIAFLAVILAQFFTWPVGLIFVYFDKIQYPVRLFPNATKISFCNGYITTPLIYSIYYLHYPRKARIIFRWSYTLLITAIPASMETLENKYTNLVHYKAWNGFYSWILLIVSYFIMSKYMDWFIGKTSKKGVSKDET